MGVQNLSTAEDSSAKGVAVDSKEGGDPKTGEQPLKRR